MPETITLYAESVDDISPVGAESIEVTLAGVDIHNLITEVGQDNLLDEMPIDEVLEYMEERKKREAEEDEEASA